MDKETRTDEGLCEDEREDDRENDRVTRTRRANTAPVKADHPSGERGGEDKGK